MTITCPHCNARITPFGCRCDEIHDDARDLEVVLPRPTKPIAGVEWWETRAADYQPRTNFVPDVTPEESDRWLLDHDPLTRKVGA